MGVRPEFLREKKKAIRLIDILLEKGYMVSIFDSEEWSVKKSTDRALLIDNVAATDFEKYAVRDAEEKLLGVFVLVYGNSVEELISDHTDNEFCWEIAKQIDAETF